MNLFLTPPTINPLDYLSPEEAAKVAGVRLVSPPSYWDDEVRQTVAREHPYIPTDRIIVNFSQRDDATGTAMGFVSLTGSPNVSIPVIIKNRELSPLDILIVRSAHPQDEHAQQGAGDMTDDRVMPLNEDTFNAAMDAGSVGTPVSQHSTTSTAYTEDASSLRLPFRGRTVVASVGVTDAQKAALAFVLEKHAEAQSILAGFALNNSGDVLDAWLSAEAPKRTWQNKLAATVVPTIEASILRGHPDVLDVTNITAAQIFVEDESTKTACVLDAIDLASPTRGTQKFLVYEDGSYAIAPSKVAGMALDETEAAKVATSILEARQAPALRIGNHLMFEVDGVCTAPAKLASVTQLSDRNSITLKLTSPEGAIYDVVLDKRIKEATFLDNTGTWVLPLNVRVLTLGDYATQAPLAPEKVASALERTLTDALTVSAGQWNLTINGQPIGTPSMPEAKMAELLASTFSNGEELMQLAKTAAEADAGGVGHIRFGSDYNNFVAEKIKVAGLTVECDNLAKAFTDDVRLPLDKAVKLAAAIGDPSGVDAVLGAGFLTQDNLSEFVNLSDEFEGTVSKLARLLLAVRMGFPGDETATVVAMKSLSRVAERLQSAGQEV